jgi:hypothetical protein
MRIVATVLGNNVAAYASSGSVVVGLHAVSRPASSGGTGVSINTLAAATAGTTTTFQDPTADMMTERITSTFALPADGFYALGFVTDATVQTAALLQVYAELQVLTPMGSDGATGATGAGPTGSTGPTGPEGGPLGPTGPTGVEPQATYLGTTGATDGTETINFDNGSVQRLILNAATAITLSATATVGTYLLLLVQGTTGCTGTWTTTVEWPGGAGPTLSTANGSVDIITLAKANGSWWGMYNLDFK